MNGHAGAFDYRQNLPGQGSGRSSVAGLSRVRGLIGNSNHNGGEKLRIKASEICFRNREGQLAVVYNVPYIELSTSIVGPNGRDFPAAWPTIVFSHVYFIYNGSTVATIISQKDPTQFNGDSLPPGFTYWAYATSLSVLGGGTGFHTFAGSKVVAGLNLWDGDPTTSWVKATIAAGNVGAPVTHMEAVLKSTIVNNSVASLLVDIRVTDPATGNNARDGEEVTLYTVNGTAYMTNRVTLRYTGDIWIRVNFTVTNVAGSQLTLEMKNFTVPNGDN